MPRLTTIIKRDGRKQKYNRAKITMATWQSLWAVSQVKRRFPQITGVDEIARRAAEIEVPHERADKQSSRWKEADRLSKIVENILIRSNGDHQWSVEEIQDIREQTLLAAGREAEAKAYIFYRNRKSSARQSREGSDFLKRSDPSFLDMPENAYAAMAKRYLWKDENGNVSETPKQAMVRVATAVAGSEKVQPFPRKRLDLKKSWRDRYLEIMTSFEFVPAGCYFRGAGNKQNGSLANCFVLPVEDSIGQIFDAVKWAALIHQLGGGSGFNFSHIRPRGDVVGSGGLASGPINFMKAFDAETQIVMQGGEHRGANMGILNVDHPDIFEFIRAKSIDGEVSNFNISVGAFDDFMKTVKNGGQWALVNPHGGRLVQKIPAVDLWRQIISLAWKTGDPGVIYLDAINRVNPLLKHLGPIESTNVCISGNSRIATEAGLIPLKEIVGKYPDGGLNIAVDKRTGAEHTQPISRAVSSGRKKTIRITTKGGYSLVCTSDHQVMTKRGWIEAGQLIVGQDKIYIQQSTSSFSKNFELPKIDHVRKYNFPTQWDKNLGLILGWLVGDGWLRNGDKNCRVGFTFGQDGMEAFEIIEPVMQSWYGKNIKAVDRLSGVKHFSFHSQPLCDWFIQLGVLPVTAESKRVPESIFIAPKEAVTGFLQGLFSSDGSVRTRNDGCKSYWVCLSSKSRSLLQDVQLLLLQFGIVSKIYDRSRKPRTGMFPYINKYNQTVTYISDGKLWELGIFGSHRDRFRQEIGFIIKAKHDKLDDAKDQEFYHQEYSDEVVSLEDNGVEEVFDLTEPTTGSMLANGLYVHNCGEQPLHPFDVCNLGSINLAKFVRQPWWENRGVLPLVTPVRRLPSQTQSRRSTGVPHARHPAISWSRLEEVVRVAVRLLDSGVDASTYPIPQIADMAHKLRRIGLGVMGWADMLAKLGVRYDSDEGAELAETVMKFIQEAGWDESEKLAVEKDPFPLWEQSYFNSQQNPFGKKRRVRNVAVTTIAPTGTISMVADCSSGIEPYFALTYRKNVVEKEGLEYSNKYYDAAKQAISEHSENSESRNIRESESQKVRRSGSLIPRSSDALSIQSFLNSIFRTAHEISPQWHVKMQAAFQKYTDNAVSKTINFASWASVKDVEAAYLLAWELGCKGITVYRDGSRAGQILRTESEGRRVKENNPERLMQSQMTITPLSQRAYKYERRQIVEDTTDGHCPDCGAVMEETEGCSLCRSCGFSQCSV